jgi:hypothetical protein
LVCDILLTQKKNLFHECVKYFGVNNIGVKIEEFRAVPVLLIFNKLNINCGAREVKVMKGELCAVPAVLIFKKSKY